MVESIKDYWLGKLLFPKTVIIDKPGVIISKTLSKYGGKENKRRIIFQFEDIIVNLQLETIKELGKEKAGKLFYQFGKDITTRYMLLSKAKKLPSFLLPSAIYYILDTFRAGGLSVAENVYYDNKIKSLILRGRNNMICRKSKLSEFTAGLVSGFFSFLVGENVEAEARCYDCPNGCVVVANKKIKEKYIPDFKRLESFQSDDSLDFLENIPNLREDSFSDLLRFKKIKIKESAQYFLDKMILPSESGNLGLIVDYFTRLNKASILKKALINGACELAEDILSNKMCISDKIKALSNMLSGLGWGVSYFKKDKDEVIFDMRFAPKNKYSFLYQALVVNGYLNSIFNKKFNIKKIKFAPPQTYRVVYYF